MRSPLASACCTPGPACLRTSAGSAAGSGRRGTSGAAARSRRDAASGAGAPRGSRRSGRPPAGRSSRPRRTGRASSRRSARHGAIPSARPSPAAPATSCWLTTRVAPSTSAAVVCQGTVGGLLRSPPRKKAPSAIMQPPQAPDTAATSASSCQSMPGCRPSALKRKDVGGDDAGAERERAQADPHMGGDLAADGAEPDQADRQRHRPGGERVGAVVAEREGQRLGGDADDLRRPDAERQGHRRAEQPEPAAAGSHHPDPAGQVEGHVRLPTCRPRGRAGASTPPASPKAPLN